ncbi:MAG: N-acetyl-gamma-glutamyl-phosphate reductase [Phycisphaeraceae bacterium]|nr:N-acetyl-gamma-glutamyl-phosphate reductase [Phycisphaeraceae bacterium]MCW5762664.1 N-acetyl-gamma-glutamyl-phosphate reductase [Phycisphaeraceae bacterium]
MTRVAIIGVGGYTGIELARLLAAHPRVELVSVHATDAWAGKALVERAPELRGLVDLTVQSSRELPDAELVFLATPHEVSADLAPVLVEAGSRVVDLSGAWRLSDAAATERVYALKIPNRELLADRVFGMPEVVRADWARARLVACAGCYPTAACVPLAPLVRDELIDISEPALVNGISGVSGAGRTPTLGSQFCEVSAKPYKVLSHRHEPEMEMACGASVVFTPHLGPWSRGILCTTHAKLHRGVTVDVMRASLSNAYGESPFVRLLPDGEWPSVGAVERTNFIDIACAADTKRQRGIVFSAIDNLLKGASGQAVQCMNLMLGFEETAGLIGTFRGREVVS